MKKKFLMVLLTIILALCSIAGLTACKHEHEYTTSVKEPTCTEQGYTTYTCSCGDNYIDNYVDEIEHDYNNGNCLNCSASIFAGDYQEISFQQAKEFNNTLTQESKRFHWEKGYVLVGNTDITYDVLPETLETVTPDKSYKINTASKQGSLVACGTANHTFISASGSNFERADMYYQDGTLYAEWTYFLSTNVKTQKKISFDEFLASMGFSSAIWDFTTILQLLDSGYYDNVKLYREDTPSYVKIKMEVPEQEKNGAKNYLNVCFVFDKNYNLTSLYYEFNMYYLGANSNSVISITESKDIVPIVSNPETYECQEHNYNAGICSVCSYNLFENIDEIHFDGVSEERIGAFVENVKNNSTQGAIEFKKYGAQIKYVGYQMFNSTKYKREDLVNVKYDNNIYNVELNATIKPATLSVTGTDGGESQIYDFEHTAFIVDKTIYSTQPNPLNNLGEITDCSADEYNSVVDIIRRMTAFVRNGSSDSWEISVAQLPMAYEMIYKLLSANYFYLKAGNYHIIKIEIDDQYMGNIETTYVYDEEYDLVGFIGNNEIGEDINTKVIIKPLCDDFVIPNEIIEKINDYNLEN